jgi:hypothetical protein
LANAASQFPAEQMVPDDEEMATKRKYTDPPPVNVTLAEDGEKKPMWASR